MDTITREKLVFLGTLLYDSFQSVLKNQDPAKAEYEEKLKQRLLELQTKRDKALKRRHDGPVTVGIFGCPSRGKSTLLNALVGAEVLPKDAVSGTTRCAVKLRTVPGASLFTIEISQMSDAEPVIYKNLDEKSLMEKLNALVTGGDPSINLIDIDLIEASGPFQSLLGGSVELFDTPGAEAAFSDRGKESENSGLADDTKRALEILAMADIPVFCMRADKTERIDAELYKKYILSLDPINVVNFMDAFKENCEYDDLDYNQEKGKLEKNIADGFNAKPRETVFVSAKDVLKAMQEWKAAGNTGAIPDSVYNEGSGNFIALKKRIEEQARDFSDNNLDVLCQKYDALVSHAYNKHDIKIASEWVYGIKRTIVDPKDETPYFEKQWEKRQAQSDADEFINRARERVEDLDAVIEILNEGLNAYPGNTELLSFRGMYFNYYIGDYAASIRDYTEVIRLNPQNAEGFNGRGDVHNQTGEYDKALADANEAIRLDPNNAHFYDTRATAYKGRKNFDEAMKNYNKAIQLDSSHGEFFNNRGDLFEKMGNYAAAIEDYTRAILHEPQNAAYYWKRGGVFFLQKKYDKAIADLGNAIKINPNEEWFYCLRGDCYRKNEDYTTAIADYTEAIRLEPKCAAAFGGRGIAYYQNDDNTRAIKDLTRAIQLDPEDVGLYYWRGNCHFKRDNYDAAITDYNSAILRDGTNRYCFVARGHAYMEKKDYNAAVWDFVDAIKWCERDNSASRKELAELYNYKGVAYSYLGKRKKAILNIEKAMELDPAENLYKENLKNTKGIIGKIGDLFKYTPDRFARAGVNVAWNAEKMMKKINNAYKHLKGSP
jgi:tetratricopeptide (TPR) repeat protein